MRRLPTRMQVVETECGLCCLSSILAYKGFSAKVTHLRERVDLGRDGTTMGELRYLATEFGLDARVLKANVAGLRRLDLPLLVHWKGVHYVVLERLGRNHAIIMDPSRGRQKISLDQLEECFTDYALEISGKNKSNDSSSRMPALRIYLRTATRSLGLVFLFTAGIFGVNLSVPFVTDHYLEDVVAKHGNALHASGVAEYSMLAILIAVLTLLQSICVARSAVLIGRHLSEGAMVQLLRLPLRFFANRQPSEIAYRLAGAAAIRDNLSVQVISGVLQLASVAAWLSYLFYNSVIIGAMGLALSLALGIILFTTRPVIDSAIQAELTKVGLTQAMQVEAIQSIETLRLGSRSDSFLSRWITENEEALRIMRRRSVIQGAVGSILQTAQVFAPIVLMVSSLFLWQRDDLTLGTALTSQAIAGSLFSSVSSIYGAWSQLQVCFQYADRLEDVMLATPESSGQTSLKSWAPVELRDVCYRYSARSDYSLRDVSVKIDYRDHVAIIGETGSGKSTLAKIVLGLLKPSSGTLSFAGIDVCDADLRTLNDVGYVPQSSNFESGSIRDNMTLDGEVSDMEIMSAMDSACIGEHVRSLPLGLDTPLGAQGANFSGGQLQRLALARALVYRPSLLVLDEATSALDSVTEAEVMRNIKLLDCAVVHVSHRSSSVKAASRVIAMTDGVVEYSGPASEAAIGSEVFRKLFVSS